MNSMQKTIKYAALTLAAFLTIGIINGMVAVSYVAFRFLSGSPEGENRVDFSQQYTGVKSLSVENTAGVLTVKTGDGFSVSATNVTSRFACDNINGTLTVKDSGFSFWPFFQKGAHSEITVYVPEGFEFDQVEMENGAGETNIETLSARSLKLETGAGRFSCDKLTAQEGRIHFGVGEASISDALLSDIKIETGVGEIVINGKILGDSSLRCGVGEAKLVLNGSSDDYNLKVETGLGGVKIDGERVSNINWNNSTASNKLKIEGGIGEISVDFKR